MATYDDLLRVRKFRSARTLFVGVVVTLGVSLLGSLPAQAAPAPVPTGGPAAPANSADAKAAWDDSSHQAEIASEQVNGAKVAQVAAAAAARRAAADLAAARSRVTSTERTAAAASAAVVSYQAKLDAFANASFRGANLSQFSVMLTAKSADDFLDESTVINRVAEDTQQTLDDAVQAKNSAAKATLAANDAAAAAVLAKATADQSSAAAGAAAAAAVSKKSDLDAAVARYQALYNKLSAQEKAAAAAAAATARQQSLAAAAALAAQQEADAAAAKQATPAVDSSSPSSSSSSASSAATAVNTAVAPVSGGDAAGQIAAAAALTKVGFAYRYAGDGPDAYDCSGLTTWAWAQAGISIPRVSYEQANFPEVPLDQLEPGDLVTYYSPVSHVAIYVGNGMVVSAADEALGIVLRPVTRGGPNPTGHRVPRG